jgi:hypothetical protein
MPGMGEGPIPGPAADQSGWVTTRVAAQALRVDPRTVRKYIKQGKLDAKVEGEGVEKAYLVSIDSVYALRGSRPDPRLVREESPRESAGQKVSEDLVALVRDLTFEINRSSSEAAELRTRLELTELAESSRREALAQKLETERVLREQAERERDELRSQLEALREPRESPVSDEEGPPYGTSPQEAEESLHHTPYDSSATPQEAEQSLQTKPRSWWDRFASWFNPPE